MVNHIDKLNTKNKKYRVAMLNIEILALDHKKNHSDRKYFWVSVEEILGKLLEGYTLSRKNKTIIIHKPLGAVGDGVEFHCYNAGSGQELAHAVLDFFEDCRQRGATWTMTPYQNPVINQLFQANIPADRLTIVTTEQGFEATTRL